MEDLANKTQEEVQTELTVDTLISVPLDLLREFIMKSALLEALGKADVFEVLPKDELDLVEFEEIRDLDIEEFVGKFISPAQPK